MKNLINSIIKALENSSDLPFSVYTSVEEQHILNVPIVKPTIIFVLSGQKELGSNPKIICQTGGFVFFADSFGIDMRNIPADEEYFALLIEFDFDDFSDHDHGLLSGDSIGRGVGVYRDGKYLVGNIDEKLFIMLDQFIQWGVFAPKEMWALRRKEVLQLLYFQGYRDVMALAGQPSLTRQVHKLIKENIADDISTDSVCRSLNMSESTLRRKLKLEQTNFQTLKDDVTLGQGLHLLQSTAHPIGYVAAECGYQSQSRFTERFKKQFGLTPSELRKTRAMTG